jgi:hypothetical protein
MAKKLLKTKSENVNGKLEVTHVYINKSVANHKANKGKNIEVGYGTLNDGCKEICPDADSGGYWLCVGSNCVYFPNP